MYQIRNGATNKSLCTRVVTGLVLATFWCGVLPVPASSRAAADSSRSTLAPFMTSQVLVSPATQAENILMHMLPELTDSTNFIIRSPKAYSEGSREQVIEVYNKTTLKSIEFHIQPDFEGYTYFSIGNRMFRFPAVEALEGQSLKRFAGTGVLVGNPALRAFLGITKMDLGALTNATPTGLEPVYDHPIHTYFAHRQAYTPQQIGAARTRITKDRGSLLRRFSFQNSGVKFDLVRYLDSTVVLASRGADREDSMLFTGTAQKTVEMLYNLCKNSAWSVNLVPGMAEMYNVVRYRFTGMAYTHSDYFKSLIDAGADPKQFAANGTTKFVRVEAKASGDVEATAVNVDLNAMRPATEVVFVTDIPGTLELAYQFAAGGSGSRFLKETILSDKMGAKLIPAGLIADLAARIQRGESRADIERYLVAQMDKVLASELESVIATSISARQQKAGGKIILHVIASGSNRATIERAIGSKFGAGVTVTMQDTGAVLTEKGYPKRTPEGMLVDNPLGHGKLPLATFTNKQFLLDILNQPGNSSGLFGHVQSDNPGPVAADLEPLTRMAFQARQGAPTPMVMQTTKKKAWVSINDKSRLAEKIANPDMKSAVAWIAGMEKSFHAQMNTLAALPGVDAKAFDKVTQVLTLAQHTLQQANLTYDQVEQAMKTLIELGYDFSDWGYYGEIWAARSLHAAMLVYAGYGGTVKGGEMSDMGKFPVAPFLSVGGVLRSYNGVNLFLEQDRIMPDQEVIIYGPDGAVVDRDTVFKHAAWFGWGNEWNTNAPVFDVYAALGMMFQEIEGGKVVQTEASKAVRAFYAGKMSLEDMKKIVLPLLQKADQAELARRYHDFIEMPFFKTVGIKVEVKVKDGIAKNNVNIQDLMLFVATYMSPDHPLRLVTTNETMFSQVKELIELTDLYLPSVKKSGLFDNLEFDPEAPYKLSQFMALGSITRAHEYYKLGLISEALLRRVVHLGLKQFLAEMPPMKGLADAQKSHPALFEPLSNGEMAEYAAWNEMTVGNNFTAIRKLSDKAVVDEKTSRIARGDLFGVDEQAITAVSNHVGKAQGEELFKRIMQYVAPKYPDCSFFVAADGAVYVINSPSETRPLSIVRVSPKPELPADMKNLFPQAATQSGAAFAYRATVPAADMEGIRLALARISAQTQRQQVAVTPEIQLTQNFSRVANPPTERALFVANKQQEFYATFTKKRPSPASFGLPAEADTLIRNLSARQVFPLSFKAVDAFKSAAEGQGLSLPAGQEEALYNYFTALLNYELYVEMANVKAGTNGEHLTNPDRDNRFAHIHALFQHDAQGNVLRDAAGNYVANPAEMTLTITKSDVYWWQLDAWSKGLLAAAPKATAGVRDTTNVVVPWDPNYPKHMLGDMLTALAQLQMVQRRMGNITPLATVAGEARYNTQLIEGLVARVFAGNGARVYTTPAGQKIPIWLDSFLMTVLGMHLGEFNTSSHSARMIACFKILKGLMQGQYWRELVACLRGDMIDGRRTRLSSVGMIIQSVENPGAQLLIEEMVDIAARVASFVETAKKDGEFNLHFASASDPNIHRDINSGASDQIPANDLYIAYLNTLYPKEVVDVIKKAQAAGLHIGYHLLHGAMAATLPEIYNKLGINGVFDYLGRIADERGYYNGIGVTDFSQKPKAAELEMRAKIGAVLANAGGAFTKPFAAQPIGYSREGTVKVEGKDVRVKFKVESDDPENLALLQRFALSFIKLGDGKLLTFYEPKYTDLSQDLSVLEVVKEAGLRELYTDKPLGYTVITTDPDGDRQVLLQVEENTPETRERLTATGLGYVVLSDAKLLTVFSPNQSFFMTINYQRDVLAARHTLQGVQAPAEGPLAQWLSAHNKRVPDMKADQWSTFDDYDWYMIPTTASTPVWIDWAAQQSTRNGKGIPCVNVPVGFKEIACIQMKVEPQVQANMLRVRRGLGEPLIAMGIQGQAAQDIITYASFMPGTSDLIRFLSQQGLAEAKIVAVLEAVDSLTRDIVVTDVRGNVVNLGKNPRLLFAGEESGGEVLGAPSLTAIKLPVDSLGMDPAKAEALLKHAGQSYSFEDVAITDASGAVTGTKRYLVLSAGILSPREKSAGEASVAVAALVSEMYLKNGNEPVRLSRHFEGLLSGLTYTADYRSDLALYDASQPLDVVKKQKKDGERWRDENNAFFRQLALLYTRGTLSLEQVEKIIADTVAPTLASQGVTLSKLKDVKFVGDGTWLWYEDAIVEIRPSGTDAKIKGYGGAKDRKRAMAYADAFPKVFPSVIADDESLRGKFPDAIGPTQAKVDLQALRAESLPEELRVDYSNLENVRKFLAFTDTLYIDYLNTGYTYSWLLDLATTPEEIVELFQSSKFASKEETDAFIRQAVIRAAQLGISFSRLVEKIGAIDVALVAAGDKVLEARLSEAKVQFVLVGNAGAIAIVQQNDLETAA